MCAFHAVCTVLGRTGLSGCRKAVAIQCRSGTARHSLLHVPGKDLCLLRCHQTFVLGGTVFRYHRPVRGFDMIHHIRLHHNTAIRHRRRDQCHMERRHKRIPLADRSRHLFSVRRIRSQCKL